MIYVENIFKFYLCIPLAFTLTLAPASETESGIWSRKSEQQEIMPGVFITSANGAVARKRDKRALRDARISHVLRVGAEFTDERNRDRSPPKL